MTRGIVTFVFAVTLLATGCGGARHRKVAGPAPEYELPEDPDAGAWRAAVSPTSPRIGGDAGSR